MSMSISDILGFAGVFILLVGFLLNLTKRITAQSAVYLWINIVGSGLALVASIMINYVPFIILEGAWVVVSAIGLFRKQDRA